MSWIRWICFGIAAAVTIALVGNVRAQHFLHASTFPVAVPSHPHGLHRQYVVPQFFHLPRYDVPPVAASPRLTSPIVPSSAAATMRLLPSVSDFYPSPPVPLATLPPVSARRSPAAQPPTPAYLPSQQQYSHTVSAKLPTRLPTTSTTVASTNAAAWSPTPPALASMRGATLPLTNFPRPAIASPPYPSTQNYSFASTAGESIVAAPTQSDFAADFAEPASCKGSAACKGSCGYWEASADLLLLRRSQLHPYGLITPNVVGDPTFNVSSLDFDFSPGLQASLGRHTTYGWDWEARALWIGDWSADGRVAGDLTLNGPGFQLAVVPSEWDVRYESSLVGAELNFGCWLDGHCGSYVGWRWLRFEDGLRVDELDVPTPSALDVDTSNDLVGLQVGHILSIADIGRFRARGFGKIGAYYNFVDSNIRSSFLGPPLVDSDYDLAFVGEFGVELAYCINECVRIRAAYEVLGVSGLATSTDQIAVSDLSTGVAGINTNSLFFDGGYVGIEIMR